VALRPSRGADSLAERLRLGTPPVVARISDGALLLDVRTVPEAELDRLAEAVASALEEREPEPPKRAAAPSEPGPEPAGDHHA
jgi:hypothetical protein